MKPLLLLLLEVCMTATLSAASLDERIDRCEVRLWIGAVDEAVECRVNTRASPS